MNLGIRDKVQPTRTTTVIDAMDSATGWAASFGGPAVGIDASSYGLANRAAAGAAAVFMHGGTVAPLGSGMAKTYAAMDLSAAARLALWVNVSGSNGGATVSHDLAIRFGTSSTVYWQYTVPGGTLVDSQWRLLSLTPASFSAVGGISLWTAITRIEFAMETAGNTGILWVDNIVALA